MPMLPELLLYTLLPEIVQGVFRVRAVPPTNAPGVPEKVMPVPALREEVATLAKVFTPEKYGMFPMTAAVEVERPPKERVAPVSICGQVAVRVSCFALKVSQSMPVRHPFTPLAEEVQSKVPLAPPMNWPRVPEYVIGAVTVGVEVAVEYSTPPAVLLSVPPVERLERLVMFWVVLTLKALPE